MKNLLHVYSPFSWHSDSCIAGNTEALTALRDAIDEAIHKGRAEAEVMATDGEGYLLHVVKINHEGSFNKLILPYTDDLALSQSPKNAVHPLGLDEE